MPGSTVSLEPLSSPSPSPPPPEEQHSNHSGAAGLDSGSELSELTEEEQDDNRMNEDSSRGTTRTRKPRGLVPQNMWDWAVKKKRSDWPPKMIEEEEEEEQAGPAKAMEEEEEDDQGKDSGSDPDASLEKAGALSDNEVDDVEEDDLLEDEGESGDEPPPQDIEKGRHEDMNGEVSGEDIDDPEDVDPEAADTLQSPRLVASPELSDEENENAGEDEVEDEDIHDAGATTKEGSEVDEDEDDGGIEDGADADEPPTTEAVTPAEVVADVLDADPDATMDVDIVQPVLMSPVAVAASSIMAGASLVQPPSPSSSQPSTPSASRVSSRFPSVEPEPEEQEQDLPSEHEAEPEPERKASTRAGRNRKGKGRTRAARRSRAAAAVEAGEVDGDVDQGDNLDGDGGDGDEDAATPDIDIDADMQPAHRAEALDVLAGIELKFALLRERLYVEKMNALAWEEGLIADGTHPELLHLHAELSSRRDKRLELAVRRRDYEVQSVTKRRRLDEAGTYSWWANERDDLQTRMISESNGKKRKLERERKILERPQPLRRFPLPLHDVPPAPSLREIVRSNDFGFPGTQARQRRRRKETTAVKSLAYPTLASLSRSEILQDLELFYSHRHMPAVGFDPHRNMPGLMNAVLSGIPHGMDPYTIGMQVVEGPSRFGHPLQQHLPQHTTQLGYTPHRTPHHHSAPPGVVAHIPPTHLHEQELHMGMRQPSNLPQPYGMGSGNMTRRSLSPVSLSNGAGPSTIHTTIGGGPVPPGFAAPKPNGWAGMALKESKRVNGEHDGRERVNERDRQRDVERERGQGRHSHLHQHAQGQTSHHHEQSHPHPQSQSAHLHDHSRHHHHHIHHHHHHPPQFPGSSSAPPPPMVGLSSGGNGGLLPQTLSPHSTRDLEPRRPRSGAPTEVIELTAPLQKHSGSLPPYWKSTDEPPPMQERTRGGPGPLGGGTHEHPITPFTLGSSQGMQQSLPSSPRNVGQGGATSHLPPSMPPSRRGSWSDEHGLPRPSSASHVPSGPQGGSMGQRIPSARHHHPPAGASFQTPFGSPPHSNGRALPLSTSPSVFVERRMAHGRPPSPSLPKMGGFPIPESGNIAPIVTGTGGHRPRSPVPVPTLLPPLPTALGSTGGPSTRLLNSALSEKVSSQLPGPATKVVPVDG